MKLNFCTNTTVNGHEIFHKDDIRENLRQYYADNKTYIVVDDSQPNIRVSLYLASDMNSLCDYLYSIYFDGNVIVRAFDNDDNAGISKFLKRI